MMRSDYSIRPNAARGTAHLPKRGPRWDNLSQMEKGKESSKNMFGQIMTPAGIVNFMLDCTGYTPDFGIEKKTILEPCCGDGAFLLEILRRFFKRCQKIGLSDSDTEKALLTHVFASDIDPSILSVFRNNVVSEFSKKKPYILKWFAANVRNFDALSDDRYGFFDFVVGNPPYIKNSKIPAETKQKFSLSSGTADMYAFFIEKALSVSKPNGTVCLITPNSWLKNRSEAKLRNRLLSSSDSVCVRDFGSARVFPDASVYACILTASLNKPSESVSCSKASFDGSTVSETAREECRFNADEIWFWPQNPSKSAKSIADEFDILNGFATNADDIYIGKTEPYENGLLKFFPKRSNDWFPIEVSIVRPCFKGSLVGSGNETFSILFPYRKSPSGAYEPIGEDEMKSAFPYAYVYFLERKETLDRRNSQGQGPFYRCGRSQALATFQRPKLVLKSYIPDGSFSIASRLINPEEGVFSGIFAVSKALMDPKEEKAKLILLQNALSSDEVLVREILARGKDVSGGYKSLQTKAFSAAALPDSVK
jgi:adenine-specific DNA-methyltransferase